MAYTSWRSRCENYHRHGFALVARSPSRRRFPGNTGSSRLRFAAWVDEMAQRGGQNGFTFERISAASTAGEQFFWDIISDGGRGTQRLAGGDSFVHDNRTWQNRMGAANGNNMNAAATPFVAQQQPHPGGGQPAAQPQPPPGACTRTTLVILNYGKTDADD